MRSYIIILIIFMCFSCHTNNNKKKIGIADSSNSVQSIETNISVNDNKWVNYIDTIDVGFVMNFKYPNNLYAENYENSICIGKKIECIDEGPITSMDFSIWMNDINDESIESIETLIKFEVKQLNSKVETIKDTIEIANVKGIRINYYNNNDKSIPLKQSIYFTKFNTFFEVNNDRLLPIDFNKLIKSIKIERINTANKNNR